MVLTHLKTVTRRCTTAALFGILLMSAMGVNAQSFGGVIVPGNTSIYGVEGRSGGLGGRPAVALDLQQCKTRVMVVTKVEGAIGCCGVRNNDADGRIAPSSFQVHGMNNLSAWQSTRGIALVGVFRSNEALSTVQPPPPFDYRDLGYDAERYSPELHQVFFIGDGFSQMLGKQQIFDVPETATQVFLGIIDRTPEHQPGQYQDNPGALRLDVEIVGCNALVS